MKLTYWFALCLDDHPCYCIRERTKKAAVAARASYDKPDESFGPVIKVTVEYKDAFDLVKRALGEGGMEPR